MDEARIISTADGGWVDRKRVLWMMALVMPTLTLGLMMTAYITRTTRSSMLNVLQEEFVRTARAKGLRERIVIAFPA